MIDHKVLVLKNGNGIRQERKEEIHLEFSELES